MKKHHKRLWMIIYIGLALSVALGLALFALRDTVSFFYSPTMIIETPPTLNRPFRLGGLVVENSLKEHPQTQEYQFSLEDGKNQITVKYKGALPSLFRDGQGIIAQGILDTNGVFITQQILAKHDENYMPPEIKKTIHIPSNHLKK